ncbi:MAG: hypothetical protein GC160_09725 [Acidobacteria bacterium]|nr:hypothetical protein [Acidobacteriota bacterium]
MTENKEIVDDLKQRRDELRVQMHLASMEARQEWEALEARWDEFVAKARLRKTSEDVEESLRMLGDELAQGYERVKAALAAK